MRTILPLGSLVGGCAKPDCGHRAPLNRHHKAHEALWLGAWAHRGQEPQWQRFIARYHEFREEDCVKLCLPHHAEIHSVYDEIIASDIARTGLPLYLYSWKQARILMKQLHEACETWLLQPSPGIDSDTYESTKKLRRALLKRQARRLHPRTEQQKRIAKDRGRKLRLQRRRRH
jgi:hypothetical protein